MKDICLNFMMKIELISALGFNMPLLRSLEKLKTVVNATNITLLWS